MSGAGSGGPTAGAGPAGAGGSRAGAGPAATGIERIRARLAESGLGLGGPGPLVALTALAVLRAVALVAIAESLAVGVTALADGTDAWRAAASWGAAAVLARAVLGWAAQTVAARLAIRSTQAVRAELVERALGVPGRGAGGAGGAGGAAGASPGRGAGGLSSGGAVVLATDGLEELGAYYRQVVPAAISAVVVPLVVGLRILGADWLSALVLVLTLPLVPLFMALIGMHTRDRVDAATGALERLGDHLVELARGLPVLVGLGRVAEQTRALARIQDDYRSRTLATLRTAFLSALALELIGTISVALVAVAIGLRLVEGQLGLETGLVVLVLAPEVFAAVREVGTAFHAAQGGLGALRRARELLGGGASGGGASGGGALGGGAAAVREPGLRVAGDAASADPGAGPARAMGGEAGVAGLSVRYPGRGGLAVADVTARFPAGRVTALAGPSGAGKSTVLAALVGALPEGAEVAGRVRVPAGPVAYAAQEPRLVADSPREELALTGASPAEIEGMLGELGLRAAADRHPALLSPGERRRVAVARALLVAPRAALLVLDEPTAHLDARHAELVRAAIGRRRGGAAVVLVSHEEETLALADERVAIPAPAVPSAAPSAPAAPPSAPARVVRFSGDPADGVRPAPANPGMGGATSPKPDGISGEAHHLGIGARAALAVLLGLAATGFGMALSAVSGWLIVRASEQPDLMYLLVAIVGVRFFGIGRAVARYAERLVTHDAAFRLTDALRLRVWGAIAARGAASARLREGGTALDYLVTLVHELRDLAPRVLAPIAVGVLALGGVVVATALVLPPLAGPVALVLGLGVALAVLVVRLVERRGAAERLRARRAHTRSLAALLRGADELRVSGLADPALARLRALAARTARLERRASLGEGAGHAVVVAAAVGLAVAVPGLAAPLVAAGTADAPLVAVIALLALASLEPALGLVDAVRLVPRLAAAAGRLRPLLAGVAETSARDAGPVAPGPADAAAAAVSGSAPARPGPDGPDAGLVLDGLSARWPGAGGPVFTGLDARVRRGEWLHVTGPSGSGKSTLLTVLLGGLAPVAGSASLDGAPLAGVGADGFTARVDSGAGEGHGAAVAGRRAAWCPQDALLFSSTIRANLLLARPRGAEPDEQEMRAVLERVGLGPLLAGLAEGLDTRVGAGGAALSGGERQRLAVARALLTRAPILLLDEPTAQLDAESAAALMSDLRRGAVDRVVVLVSHRAADARPGDVVLPLGGDAEDAPGESAAADPVGAPSPALARVG